LDDTDNNFIYILEGHWYLNKVEFHRRIIKQASITEEDGEAANHIQEFQMD
jgi:hypothetical protein